MVVMGSRTRQTASATCKIKFLCRTVATQWSFNVNSWLLDNDMSRSEAFDSAQATVRIGHLTAASLS
jgi:hypothetical protein